MSGLFADLLEVTESQKITWLMHKLPPRLRDDLMNLEKDEADCSSYKGIISVLLRKAHHRLRLAHMTAGLTNAKLNYIDMDKNYANHGMADYPNYGNVEHNYGEKVFFGKGKGVGKGGGKGGGKGKGGLEGKGGRGDGRRVGKFEATIECWHCGKKGHYKDECWWLKEDARKKEKILKDPKKAEDECHHCKKKGHHAKDCWAKGGQSEGKGPNQKGGKAGKGSKGGKGEGKGETGGRGEKRGREEEDPDEVKKQKLLRMKKQWEKNKKKLETAGLISTN
jgi:hypothetical protein